MPKFLFFSFELSDGSQNDIYQFRNLITYRDTIKAFIVETLIFNDINYKLSGIICMESVIIILRIVIIVLLIN